MTVQEMIAALQNFAPDQKVGFAFPSGDYWGNVLVREVTSVDEGEVRYSNYHESNTLLGADDYDEGDEIELWIVLQ